MAYAGYLIRVGNYTIPKKYIRAEKYDVVLHGQDLDSYRDANGQLQRTALQHMVVDVNKKVEGLYNALDFFLLQNTFYKIFQSIPIILT